jgi:hypothetical protein
MGSENSVPDTAHILLIPGSLCCHDWVEDLVRHSRRPPCDNCASDNITKM